MRLVSSTRVPGVLFHIEERRARRDARIVDQDIQPAQGIGRFCDRALDRSGIGNVQLDNDGGTARLR